MKTFSRETVGLLLGLLAVTLFGGVLPATRLALADFDPLPMTAARAVLGGLASALVLFATRQRWPKPALLGRLLLVTLTVALGFPLFSTLASVSVPAAHGGVVLGLLPLTTAIAAALFAGERPSPAFWACSVAGAALVVAYTLRQGGGSPSVGDLWLVGAIVCASLGYTASAGLARLMPGWVVISWALALTLPLALPALLLLWPPVHAGPGPRALGGFFYISLISQYLAFFFWNAGLAVGGVARVSQVQLLQTFVTIALASLVAGEAVDVETIACAGAVFGLVLLSRRLRVTRK